MKKSPIAVHSTFDRFFLPNRILCSFVGLWPMEDNCSRAMKAVAIFRVLLALAAVSSFFVPEILQIAMNWGDIEVLTGVGCVCTSVGQLLFKMFYLLARRKRMTRLYQEVRKTWHVTDVTADRKCFEKIAYQAKIFTIGFYLSALCNVVTFTTAAAVVWIKQSRNNQQIATRALPFEVWYGPEELSSSTFAIAFVCQFLGSLICCAGISGLDATLMTLVLHICGQFKVIQVWFLKIGSAIEEERMEPCVVRARINRCIRHHQQMTNMADKMNDMLSPILLVQLLTSGLEICLSGYALLSGTGGTDFLKFTSYLLSMIVQLVIWCWPAQLLIDESQRVGHVVYSGVPWYALPAACQKDISTVIARTQRHCRITMMVSEGISIGTLTDVFRTASSYFTLLRQMQMS